MNMNDNYKLYGAIIGDIAGSCYEFNNNKNYNCELFPAGCNFTDDTIMTIATADVITGGQPLFHISYKHWGRKYPCPKGGYGGRFSDWLTSNNEFGYNSMGNGAGMRVSPCAYFATLGTCLVAATDSAICTHNHWKGVRAAQSVVNCIFTLRSGAPASYIRQFIMQDVYEYSLPSLDASFEEIQKEYRYSELADDTIPIAIWCALSASSFEDAIRRAVSLGGDADTLGAIAGSVAECLFPIPSYMIEKVNELLPEEMKDVIQKFNVKFK